MTDINPLARFLVDFDNDGFICADAKLGDALNLIPNALYIEQFIRTASDYGGTYETVKETSPHGIVKDRVQYFEVENEGVYLFDVFPVSSPLDAEPHTFTIWIKGSTDVVAGAELMINVLCHTIFSSTAYIFTFDSNYDKWTRFDLPITALEAPDLRGIRIASNENSIEGMIIELTGHMLTKDSDGPVSGYNTGHLTNVYDNLTKSGFVKSLNWQSGRSGYDDIMPSDGTCSVVLNNESRVFSPEYEAGPLYGYLVTGHGCEVQIRNSETDINEYSPAWTGRLESFVIKPGRYRSREAEFKAIQGIMNFERDRLDFDILLEATADEGLAQLFQNYRRPLNPYTFILDRSLLDYSAYIYDTAFDIDFETGSVVFEVIGDGWKKTTDIAQAIADLTEAERGLFWVDRGGKARFRGRSFNEELETDLTTIDENVFQDGTYEYGGEISNVIKVNFNPKRYEINTLLYSTAEDNRIEVLAGQSKTVRLIFKREDESDIKALDVYSFSRTITDGTRSIYATYRSDTGAARNAALTIGYKKTRNGVVVKMRNNSSIDTKVDLQIYGTAIITDQEQTVEITDEDSILKYGRKVKVIDLPMIDNETEALAWAEAELDKHKDATGKFTSLTFTVTSDLLTMINDTPIGTHVYIEEYQTSNVGDSIVVGEAFDYSGTVLSVDYTLYPIFLPED